MRAPRFALDWLSLAPGQLHCWRMIGTFPIAVLERACRSDDVANTTSMSRVATTPHGEGSASSSQCRTSAGAAFAHCRRAHAGLCLLALLGSSVVALAPLFGASGLLFVACLRPTCPRPEKSEALLWRGRFTHSHSGEVELGSVGGGRRGVRGVSRCGHRGLPPRHIGRGPLPRKGRRLVRVGRLGGSLWALALRSLGRCVPFRFPSCPASGVA